MYTVLLAFGAALAFGGADFSGGLASRTTRPSIVILLGQVVGVVLALVAAPLLGAEVVTPRDLLLGAASGLAGALGLAFLYRALATSIVAIASPVAAVIGALVPLGYGIAMGETLSATDWMGVAIALPAILLLSWEPSRQSRREAGQKAAETGLVRRALILASMAGIGFGLFFVLVSETAPASGLWPLVAARITSVIVLVGLAVARSVGIRVAPGARMPAIGAGALDMLANVLFLLAARTGLLAVAVVVSSLYPAPTVVRAALHFRERLAPSRVAGLIMAICSVALMSV